MPEKARANPQRERQPSFAVTLSSSSQYLDSRKHALSVIFVPIHGESALDGVGGSQESITESDVSNI